MEQSDFIPFTNIYAKVALYLESIHIIFRICMVTLSIIIPSHNEAKTIAKVVRSLDRDFRGVEEFFEIIVVDNGSTDETSQILNDINGQVPSLVTIRVFPNCGYGNGILAGLSAARGEIVGWMHADGQVSSRDVVLVYQKLQNENLDFCKVRRSVRREHLFRIIQSKVYNIFFNLLFKTPCSDINASPKLFRKTLIDNEALSSRDWFIDPEIVIRAARKRARIGEVSVIWDARTDGSSKVKMTTSFEFIKNMIQYRFFRK